VDDSGKSNERYTLSLAFGQTETAQEQEFLKKLKDFENKIIEDAATNSEAWFGEPMTKEVLKHMYFPFLKYPKVKGTKRNDESKPPTLRAKVPFYNGEWGDSFVIFSSNKEKLFPSELNQTPIELIPKMSKVACVLQFSGLWFGGKGWGITIRATQAVVRPQHRNNINAQCQIELDEDYEQQKSKSSTYDSDEEPTTPLQKPVAPTLVKEQEPEQVEEEQVKEPEPTIQAPAAAAPKKKIVKKAST
jgi:hypothetical protein